MSGILSLTPEPALGFLELSSISKGLFVTDAILKKAPVRIVGSEPFSSGKFYVLFFGDVASVEESYLEGVSLAKDALVRKILIQDVHPSLVPYLLDPIEDRHAKSSQSFDSLAVVESKSLAGAILAADRALKTSQVSLNRLRLGKGIGGKAYFILSGRLEELQAALEISQSTLKDMESFEMIDLIANPHQEAYQYF